MMIPPFFFISRSKSPAIIIGASILTATISCILSGFTCSCGPKYPTPAQLTRILICPASALIASISFFTSICFFKSQILSWNNGASKSSLCPAKSLPIPYTSYPDFNKADAVAAPIPLDAPVTIAFSICHCLQRYIFS